MITAGVTIYVFDRGQGGRRSRRSPAATTRAVDCDGILAAASGAGLLVVGLSDRWKKEGLGPTRAEIAKSEPAPVLFVRRGSRPGAPAPRGEVTRVGWSFADSGQAAKEFLAGGGREAKKK